MVGSDEISLWENLFSRANLLFFVSVREGRNAEFWTKAIMIKLLWVQGGPKNQLWVGLLGCPAGT